MGNATPTDELFVGSHEMLFEQADAVRCDACGEPLPVGDDRERDEASGQGVYLWKRGDRVDFDHVPLCSHCASAIGVTALARWEIEEEEG